MPRGLTILEAAQYCGVSSSTYRQWMCKGIVPRPWPQTRRVDRFALDDALNRMSGHGEKHELGSSFEKWESTLDRGDAA